MTNETDIARAVAEGRLPSPTTFLNSALYRMRFSGTGAAWRPSIREFCYRPPDVWLSPKMCARVAGVPVIAEHPNKATLDGKEFFDRVVGVCVFGFVERDELWSIARIIDKRARQIIDAGEFDTSPCVVFEPGVNITLRFDNADSMLIENEPALIDHLALVSRGVWNCSKDGADVGVEISKEVAT